MSMRKLWELINQKSLKNNLQKNLFHPNLQSSKVRELDWDKQLYSKILIKTKILQESVGKKTLNVILPVFWEIVSKKMSLVKLILIASLYVEWETNT